MKGGKEDLRQKQAAKNGRKEKEEGQKREKMEREAEDCRQKQAPKNGRKWKK